jgi:sporulation protein YlmC with PRC-barrel domain
LDSRFFKREELKGKLVIDQDANIVGKMEDFTISETGEVGFLIRKEDVETIITINQIKKINDVLLLKEIKEKKEEKQEEASEATTEQVKDEDKCTNCGENIRPGTRFCVKCGTALN